jgi:signal transduction histidine kinase
MGTLGGEQVEAIGRVLRAARNLHLRVDDVLFFVQLDADRVVIQPEPVDVERVITEVVEALADRPSPERVAFRVEIDPRARTIATDGTLLRRILFHLLGNAFKFTEEGTVRVSVAPGVRAEDVAIVVRDSGVGIPPDRQRAIFEAFVQADQSDARRFEGLGMGLALVQRAAQLLGGRVSVESIAGSGSEFTIDLPCALPIETTAATTTTFRSASVAS